MKRTLAAALCLVGASWSASASAHEFLVYFKADSTEFFHADPTWPLDVMKDTACYARLPGVTQVEVVASADASGDALYNLDLSYRRARKVADHLVREGVDPRKITVRLRGEAQQAVATPDGVPEVLNRLAVVDINFAPTPRGSSEPGGPATTGPSCTGRTLPKLPPR